MIILLGCAFELQAQQVTLQLSKPPAQNETIFVAGNMNGWKPNDASYKFDAAGKLTITAKSGDLLEFKCTLGSWEKVEVTAAGNNIQNRVLKVGGDTTVVISIAGWSHLFQSKEKQRTASAQVSIFDSAFYFPSLGYAKTIRIYLPPNYANTKKKYPVLYMHDGQNIFDEFTSGYGEWHVDEAMDSLYKATGLSFIVVGIDHGNEKRINEYNPYDSTKYGKGVGEKYVRDVAEVLKPNIDKAFRTSTQAKHTWIAGSSMGGLISAYGVFIYPKTFGGAGVFSPAFWINQSVENTAVQYSKSRKRKHKFFFYAGGKESASMVSDMGKIASIVCNDKTVHCETTIDAEAKHNEDAWTIHFHEFLKFMMENKSVR